MTSRYMPRGDKHIQMLVELEQIHRAETTVLLKHNFKDARLLGTALSALLEVSTCHRSCRGGTHVLESLAGRTYNVACSAFSLITLGFYDEAMVLVRSLGEITNLLSLSVYNEEMWHRWLSADKKTRLNEFAPAKVRNLIGSNNVMPMKRDWYSDLCEKYVHITPDTRPNRHSDEICGSVGGFVQDKGLNESLGHLTFITGAASFFFSKQFGFDDMIDLIESDLKAAYEFDDRTSS